MKNRLILFIFASSILLVGCASFSKDMNGLVGKLTYECAVETWGPPKSEEKLSNGDRLVKWTFDGKFATPLHVESSSSNPNTPAPMVTGGGVKAAADTLFVTFSKKNMKDKDKDDVMINWRREYY